MGQERRVDTARNRWKDAGHGKGIIPNDDRKTGFTPGDESDSSSLTSDSSASYSAGSDLHENEDTHYVGLDKPNGNNWFSRQKNKLGPKGIKKKLLRKTIRRNTWIYVSDLNMNFFMEDKGADLSHVKIAKSVMTLWGLGKYGSATKKEKNLVTKFKSAVGLSHEQTEEEKSQELKENAEAEEREHQDRIRAIRARVRREILYGRKKEKEQKKEDTAAALRTA
ncbi:hypothetical protein BD324DRAFT_210415 [Kockovaella imperatae]|uniref:Uncharacterized protein n=1 Tax=Kockovaella imperatae TaxID=4999 RepID=A0A1Y1U6J8_9TREE|nr:hypothetical protein BD324DRAFT_210415 [Kockovaella imperatae]ORX33660.1 hypothetical protein BD324DRAFT_210415 [Kockovaella imperatae]